MIGARFNLFRGFAPDMSNQHHGDENKHDNIEEHDGKYWSKKGTPKCSNMGQETSAKRYLIIIIEWMDYIAYSVGSSSFLLITISFAGLLPPARSTMKGITTGTMGIPKFGYNWQYISQYSLLIDIYKLHAVSYTYTNKHQKQ